MKIYSSVETNFTHNGYGILIDAILCNNKEFLNSQYDIKLIYPTNGYLSEYLVENNIIKADVGRPEGEQLFRIKIAPKNLNEITIVANHISFDLENNMLVDNRPTNLNGAGAIDHMLSNTQFPHSFTSNSDIDIVNSATYIRKNVITALTNDENGFCKRWKAELLRDNFLIYAKNSIGQNRGIKIQYSRNLKAVSWDIDPTEIATRIIPQGTNELILPEQFIDSPLIGIYPTPVVRNIKFNTIGIIDGETTEEQAYQLLRDGVQELYDNGIDKPIINVSIDMIDLSKTTAYKNYSAFEIVRLGDIVIADIPQLNIQEELKVIGVEYDVLLKKYTKFYLSNSNKSIKNYIIDLSNSVKNANDAISEIKNLPGKSILNQAQANATDLINSAQGGNATKTQSEFMILDTGNPTTAVIVSRWNINGIGYSNNGINGEYNVAITRDGQIVADRITLGELNGALIKAGSIITDSLSIETQKQFAKNGDNHWKNTMFYGWSYLGSSLNKRYIESETPPTDPIDGLYWYCTSSSENYINGKVYLYQSSEWVTTAKTRKELDDSSSLIRNVNIIENDETKLNYASGRKVQFYLNGNQNNIDGMGILSTFPSTINADEEYMTMSYKIKNNLEYGDICVGVDFLNNYFNTVDDLFSSAIFEYSTYYSPDQAKNLTLETKKVYNQNQLRLIYGVVGEVPPEDTEKYWLSNGMLLKYNIDNWYPYETQNSFVDEATGDLYCNMSNYYQNIGITPENYIAKLSMGLIMIVPSYITEVDEIEPFPYEGCYWAKESTNEIKRASFNESGNFLGWKLIDVTYTQAVANGTAMGDNPFVYPKGTVDWGVPKFQDGDYSSWTPNRSEAFGVNFYWNDKGLTIKRGDNERIIDEDEDIVTYKGKVVYKQDGEELFVEKLSTNELEVDGLVSKSIVVGLNKIAIRYMR